MKTVNLLRLASILADPCCLLPNFSRAQLLEHDQARATRSVKIQFHETDVVNCRSHSATAIETSSPTNPEGFGNVGVAKREPDTVGLRAGMPIPRRHQALQIVLLILLRYKWCSQTIFSGQPQQGNIMFLPVPVWQFAPAAHGHMVHAVQEIDSAQPCRLCMNHSLLVGIKRELAS